MKFSKYNNPKKKRVHKKTSRTTYEPTRTEVLNCLAFGKALSQIFVNRFGEDAPQEK